MDNARATSGERRIVEHAFGQQEGFGTGDQTIRHPKGAEHGIEPVLSHRVAEDLGPGVAGDADEAGKPLPARLLERCDGSIRRQRLFQVRPGVHRVHLHEVDVVGLELAQRLLQFIEDTVATPPVDLRRSGVKR